MFLPPFINVLFLVPKIWRKFSGTPASKGFTHWAVPAVIGGILGTTLRLGWITLNSPFLIALFLIGLALALRFKPPAWLLIPLCGATSGLWQFLA
jgi:chromate transport protein ChrA